MCSAPKHLVPDLYKAIEQQNLDDLHLTLKELDKYLTGAPTGAFSDEQPEGVEKMRERLARFLNRFASDERAQTTIDLGDSGNSRIFFQEFNKGELDIFLWNQSSAAVEERWWTISPERNLKEINPQIQLDALRLPIATLGKRTSKASLENSLSKENGHLLLGLHQAIKERCPVDIYYALKKIDKFLTGVPYAEWSHRRDYRFKLLATFLEQSRKNYGIRRQRGFIVFLDDGGLSRIILRVRDDDKWDISLFDQSLRNVKKRWVSLFNY